MGQTTITQQEGQVTAEERDTFQTTCAYQTTNRYGLFWYQQKKGQGPQLVLYQASAVPKHGSCLTMLLNMEVKVSDSAVYLCAVQDTLVQGASLASATTQGREGMHLCEAELGGRGALLLQHYFLGAPGDLQAVIFSSRRRQCQWLERKEKVVEEPLPWNWFPCTL